MKASAVWVTSGRVCESVYVDPTAVTVTRGGVIVAVKVSGDRVKNAGAPGCVMVWMTVAVPVTVIGAMLVPRKALQKAEASGRRVVGFVARIARRQLSALHAGAGAPSTIPKAEATRRPRRNIARS